MQRVADRQNSLFENAYETGVHYLLVWYFPPFPWDGGGIIFQGVFPSSQGTGNVPSLTNVRVYPKVI
jgi:hypothetical protein